MLIVNLLISFVGSIFFTIKIKIAFGVFYKFYVTLFAYFFFASNSVINIHFLKDAMKINFFQKKTQQFLYQVYYFLVFFILD